MVLMESLQASIQATHLKELCLKLLHVLAELSVVLNQYLALLPAGVCEFVIRAYVRVLSINCEQQTYA